MSAPAVVTRAYNNLRSGSTSDGAITASQVKARGIKVAWQVTLQDDARGAESQPLFAPQVRFPGGQFRDLMIVSTMGNYVHAFDANTGELIWATSLGLPVKGSKAIDGWAINDHWGVLSTGVLDSPAVGMWYGCAWISQDGSTDTSKAAFYVVGIDLTDGSQPKPMIPLEGVTYTPGHGLPVQQFASAARKQRASLAFVGTTLCIPFGSVSETSRSARGWIICIDTVGWKVQSAWTATSRGFGAGIWQAGSGIAAYDGKLYAMTGNGTWDAKTDWAQSLLEIAPGPTDLTVTDWFTAWTDDARTALDPTGDEYSEPTPTNVRAYTRNVKAGWGDQDFGSSGPTIVPSLGLVTGCGKDGILLAAKLGNMGKTQPADLEPDANAGNYAKLAFPPVFFTYFPGYQMSPAPANITDLNVWWQNKTHHLHADMVHWKSDTHGDLFFVHGENGYLREWAVTSTSIRWLADGPLISSPDCQNMGMGGMPGGMMTLSANGGADGVLIETIPYGDANMQITPGHLVCYDVNNFANGQIPVIWDSADWGIDFTFNKFLPPVVWNGRVYLTTYDARVIAFELA